MRRGQPPRRWATTSASTSPTKTSAPRGKPGSRTVMRSDQPSFGRLTLSVRVPVSDKRGCGGTDRDRMRSPGQGSGRAYARCPRRRRERASASREKDSSQPAVGAETPADALARGSSPSYTPPATILVRHGKGGKRREVGMDRWAREQLTPWLHVRARLPAGGLFCVLRGPTTGCPWAPAGACATGTPRRPAQVYGVGSHLTGYGTLTRSRCRAKACRCLSSSANSATPISRSPRSICGDR
jgi:hypothetical protein